MSRIPLLNAVRSLWFRAGPVERRYEQTIGRIHDLAAALRGLADRDIAQRSDHLRQQVQAGAGPASENVLIPGLALINEAMRRVLSISLYDVQLQAGLALSRQTIAEMQTGEGKTFVTAVPAYIRALAGRGVHVMTVNAYLAERDYEQLRGVFAMLGISVGLLRPKLPPKEKQSAYACDITYGPGYEFGFDYLRDQVACISSRKPRLGENYRNLLHGLQEPEPDGVQRGFAFAVVDEIDSVLIDEAATPLLISAGPSTTAANAAVYVMARDAAGRLVADRDYFVDRAGAAIQLSVAGNRQIVALGRRASQLGLDRPWATYVEQALRAELLLQRDVEYVVEGGRIMLVDGNTGRIFSDRSWRDGLHQAVQAKEGVAITGESRPLARMSRQRFFGLYEGICGLTGTAVGSRREFWDVYRLGVEPILLRKPSRRISHATRYFADASSKYRAITAEVQRLHRTEQPVLVGTRTIQSSEQLAKLFDDRGICYSLLNGKQDTSEASIVAAAGERGAVTIATNMAGRGTDIKLGAEVAALGGLYVIGAERNESARIDRQLAGRAARQGDPGCCRFFVAADDRLIALYAPRLARRMSRLADREGEIPVDFSREVAKVQRNCERMHRLRRHRLFAHDDWLEEVLARLAKER